MKDLQSVFAKGKFNGPLLVGRGKKTFPLSYGNHSYIWRTYVRTVGQTVIYNQLHFCSIEQNGTFTVDTLNLCVTQSAYNVPSV